MLSTMFVGCGVKFGSESRNNKSNLFSINNENEEEENYTDDLIEKVDISEELDGINKLDISIDVSNVEIEYYDGNTIRVKGKLSKYSKGINIEKETNKINIIEKSKRSINISEDYSSDLTISIPRNFNGDLEFSFGVGECKIDELELDNVSIKSGVGELELEDIAFNKLNLESGVGTVTLETEKKTGEITIKGGVGETNVSLGDINGNLKFEGGMGSATIKVPVDSPIAINTNSGLGDVKIKAKTSNESKYNFDITVGIGSVEIIN